MTERVESIRLEKLDSSTIDDILDEIDANEQKQNKQLNKINDNSVNWDKIRNEIGKNNITFIKNLVTSNDININAQNPSDGKTLLIYAVIICNFDLVQVICNFGADVHIKDHDDEDALDYAMKYSQYKIQELLYYQQLSGKLGKDLKNIATQIHDKNKQVELMKEIGGSYDQDFMVHIVSFMIKAIKLRLPFGSDLLYYAWWREIPGNYVENEYYTGELGSKGLQSELWKQMMETFEEILCNTSDKSGWLWLKRYFINSLIWFLPHTDLQSGNDDDDDDDEGDMENVLKKTLFHELLIRVRRESKKQSDMLLKDKINKIKREKPNEWKQLISYNINTKYSKTARQDLCDGCLKSKYSADDLSSDKYPPSTHFNAKKHYDSQIYLSELLFSANIIDAEFQKDMKLITAEISSKNNINVQFRAGPVKTLTRSQTKVENDYINEKYPKSAKLLDINRCALQFTTINDMMMYLQVFVNKINNKNARSITEIVRLKNGWTLYSEIYPQYTDIKLNCLVKSISDSNQMSVIVEIQFLLDVMSAFKKKSHKLYSIERKFELVYNFGKLKQEMAMFKDGNVGINGALNGLTSLDIKYFKYLWCLVTPSAGTLFGHKVSNVWNSAIMNIICKDDRAEINNYLEEYFDSLYFKSIVKYIKCYVKENYYFSRILDEMESDENLTKLMSKLLNLTKNNKNRQKILMQILSAHKDASNMTFIEELYRLHGNKYCVALRLILKNNYKLLFGKYDKYNLESILQILQYVSNNRKLVLRLVNKTSGRQTALEIISCNKSPVTTKIFKLILNDCRSVTYKDKKKILLNRNILFNICKPDEQWNQQESKYDKPGGYDNNLFVIMDYFESTTDGKKQANNLLKRLLSNEFLSPTLIFNIYHRYCFENKYFLLKQLKNGGLFTKICKVHIKHNHVKDGFKSKYIEELKYILVNSAMNDMDKLKLINCVNNKDVYTGWNNQVYDGKVLYDAEYIYESCIALIKYLQNDQKKLLKFLSNTDKNGQVCCISICNATNKKSVFLAMQLIVNAINDKRKLFSIRDLSGKNILHHSLTNNANNKYPITQIILKSLRYHKHLLLSLLFEETHKDKQCKQCIFYCVRAKDLEIIFDILNDKQSISKLYKQLFLGTFQNDRNKHLALVMHEWLKYIDFVDKGLKIGVDIAIDDVPFMTLCKYGKIEIIKTIIETMKDKKTGIIKLLSRYAPRTNIGILYEIVNLNNFQYKDEMKILLQIVLLNNAILTDEDKVNLLLSPQFHDDNKHVLMNASNNIRLMIIENIGNNKKCLLQILTQKDRYNRQLLYYILESNDHYSFKFIFYSSILNDKERIKLLNNSTNQNHWEIYKYLKNVRQIIKKKEKLAEKALFDLCSDFNNNNSHNILEMVNDLRKYDKQYIEALLYTEKGEPGRGGRFGHNNAHYFTSLMEICENEKNVEIIKLILRDINNMDHELQLKLLMIKDKWGKNDNETFIFKIRNAKHMKVVFSILNNNIIRILLNDKNHSGYTLQEKLRLSDDQFAAWTSNWDTIYANHTKYEIEMMISEYLDYLKFDTLLHDDICIDLSFTQYTTNPFITACYLGKVKTIYKLLNFIGDNKEKFKLLFFEGYNKLNGNNCLMELAQNGNSNIVLDILNALNINNFNHLKTQLLSMKNKYSGQTLLIYLCKVDAININCNHEVIKEILSTISNKETVFKLLKQKDNKNRSCFDYATQNTLKYIHQCL